MEFTQFFNPVSIPNTYLGNPEKMGSAIRCFSPSDTDWRSADIILLGCEKDRNCSTRLADVVRAELYNLSLPATHLKIMDMGNLIFQDTKEESSETLGFVLERMIRAGKIGIVLGMSREIAYGQTLAYRYASDTPADLDGQHIEYVYVSSALDMTDTQISKEEESVNYRIFNQFPPRVNGLTGIGMQKYRLTQAEIQLMQNLNFSILRYGEIAGNITAVEPYFREAQAVCIDMSSVRHSDSPGSNRPSPGGFSVMEICRIARFAGASMVNTLSITETNPMEDIHNQTTMLSAMLIWYFCEGFYTKVQENPQTHSAHFKTYRVQLNASVDEIVFYQSNLTERWWMEVKNHPRKKIVPCTEAEYLCASKNEIPDRWWQIFNRLA